MRIILSLATLATLSTLGGAALSIQKPDVDEWYGTRLGANTTAGSDHNNKIADQIFSIPVQQPWSLVNFATDQNGRICELVFVDIGVNFMTDMPPGYVPKRVKSKAMIRGDAKAALAYVIARLGPASKGFTDRPEDGVREFVWYRPEDRDSVFRSASLLVSSDSVALTINGPIVASDTMSTSPDTPQYDEGDCRRSTNLM